MYDPQFGLDSWFLVYQYPIIPAPFVEKTLLSPLNCICILDFPGGSDSKASAYNAGDPGSTPGLGRSGEGNGNPLQYSCLEKSHGWSNLAGYIPWGCKESDTTERLHFLFFFLILFYF